MGFAGVLGVKERKNQVGRKLKQTGSMGFVLVHGEKREKNGRNLKKVGTMEFALVHGKKNIREKEELEKEDKKKQVSSVEFAWEKIERKRSWKRKIKRVGSMGFAWVH